MDSTVEKRKMMYELYSKLRDDRGVTDYEVSKQTGISTVTLTSWKQEKYTPKADKIAKLAEYFNVDIGYFFKVVE